MFLISKLKSVLAVAFVLYVICLLPTFATAEVGAYPYELILESIEKHPAVVEKKNQIALKGLDIDVKIAQDGVKINFSTRSKMAIVEHLNTNQYRVDDIDRSYIDGVVTVEKTIYDAGKSEYEISSEKSKQKAAELDYIDTYETTLQTLLNNANEAGRISDLIISVDRTIQDTKKMIKQIKVRFSSGVGTIMEVRQAQLILVDLEMEQQELKRQYELVKNNLENEFGIQADKISNIVIFTDYFIAGTEDEKQIIGAEILQQSDPFMPRTKSRINHEKTAINSQIKSLKAEKSFSLSGTLTGVVYDVTRGGDEYEMYGGANLSLPIYDSGLNQAQQTSLAFQLNLQSDVLAKLINDRQLEMNSLSKRYQQLIKEQKKSKDKVDSLKEKLSHIDLKLTTTGEGLLNKLQTIIKLAEVERIVKMYPYHERSIILDYFVLNEQLLNTATIDPVILN